MNWVEENTKPHDFEVILLMMNNGDFTVGWYSSRADSGRGSWFGASLNQNPPFYKIEKFGVKMWCAIEPPANFR